MDKKKANANHKEEEEEKYFNLIYLIYRNSVGEPEVDEDSKREQ